MIKLLIGGSPCTFWSIAQRNNRETEADGLGWELFKNYLIAKEKFKPDFFLYENNKSAAKAIKDQISHELGVELMYINSALVSAQNRQRFYAFNWEVEQPEDRGILLKDILENGVGITKNGKSYCLTTTYGSAYARDAVEYRRRTLVAQPVSIGYRNRREDDGKLYRRFETSGDPKANAITTVQTDSMVAQPIRVGQLEKGGKSDRVYSIPTNEEVRDVYKVENGLIEIKGRKYNIKLADGYYIIRKLTPIECERLQTMPDNYTAAVSNAQRYKCLGNGWTAEVIIHILHGALKNVPKDEEIVVLSMYDGIGTGRYCLDKMGFTNVKYFAYEIDKYAKKIALKNYPDIIQMGDAFNLRNPDWTIGY